MTPKRILRRIDDPFDAAKTAYPKNEENVPANVALRVGSCVPLLGPVVGVVNEARAYFSAKATNERLDALIEAVNEKTEYLTARVEDHTKAIDDIQSRIESPEFATAFREASVQTLFATEQTKVRYFGAILGSSIGSENWLEISSDLTSFIKAISQLGEKDIESLRLLHSVFADVVKVYPNMHDPNPFTERAQELLKAVGEAGFHRDDFYAHCRRLEGFGLAMEVPRNTSRMAPGDYCFRPTRTGMKLVGLLGDEKAGRVAGF
jgi:hypothetical protein